MSEVPLYPAEVRGGAPTDRTVCLSPVGAGMPSTPSNETILQGLLEMKDTHRP